MKQLLVAALNRKDREREQVSQLLVRLHPNVSGRAGARALGRERALWVEAAAAGPLPTHCHPAHCTPSCGANSRLPCAAALWALLTFPPLPLTRRC